MIYRHVVHSDVTNLFNPVDRLKSSTTNRQILCEVLYNNPQTTCISGSEYSKTEPHLYEVRQSEAISQGNQTLPGQEMKKTSQPLCPSLWPSES